MPNIQKVLHIEFSEEIAIKNHRVYSILTACPFSIIITSLLSLLTLENNLEYYFSYAFIN